MRGKHLLIAVVGAIIATGAILFATGSPVIEGIEIESGERIGISEIQALSGFRVGQPWSASQSENATHAILDLPLVRNVSVSAQRSSLQGVRVQIKVSEREPFAVISLQNRELYWVDREGHLLYPVEGKSYLPVLSGAAVQKDENENELVTDEAKKIIEDFFALPGDLIGRFQSVTFSGSSLELVTYEKQKVRVTASSLKEQLEQLEQVTKKFTEDGIPAWSLIDLRFAGEVTLRR